MVTSAENFIQCLFSNVFSSIFPITFLPSLNHLSKPWLAPMNWYASNSWSFLLPAKQQPGTLLKVLPQGKQISQDFFFFWDISEGLVSIYQIWSFFPSQLPIEHSPWPLNVAWMREDKEVKIRAMALGSVLYVTYLYLQWMLKGNPMCISFIWQ